MAPADVPSLNELLSLPYGPAWLRGSQGSFLLQSRAGGRWVRAQGGMTLLLCSSVCCLLVCFLMLALNWLITAAVVICDFLSVEQKKNALCTLFVLR